MCVLSCYLLTKRVKKLKLKKNQQIKQNITQLIEWIRVRSKAIVHNDRNDRCRLICIYTLLLLFFFSYFIRNTQNKHIIELI